MKNPFLSFFTLKRQTARRTLMESTPALINSSDFLHKHWLHELGRMRTVRFYDRNHVQPFFISMLCFESEVALALQSIGIDLRRRSNHYRNDFERIVNYTTALG